MHTTILLLLGAASLAAASTCEGCSKPPPDTCSSLASPLRIPSTGLLLLMILATMVLGSSFFTFGNGVEAQRPITTEKQATVLADLTASQPHTTTKTKREPEECSEGLKQTCYDSKDKEIECPADWVYTCMGSSSAARSLKAPSIAMLLAVTLMLASFAFAQPLSDTETSIDHGPAAASASVRINCDSVTKSKTETGHTPTATVPAPDHTTPPMPSPTSTAEGPRPTLDELGSILDLLPVEPRVIVEILASVGEWLLQDGADRASKGIDKGLGEDPNRYLEAVGEAAKSIIQGGENAIGDFITGLPNLIPGGPTHVPEPTQTAAPQ